MSDPTPKKKKKPLRVKATGGHVKQITPEERHRICSLGGKASKRAIVERTTIHPEMYEKLRRMAMLGMSVQSIATILGMGVDTWRRRLKQDPELARIYAEGMAAGEESATVKLHENIAKGEQPAINFYLKVRHRWVEPPEDKDPEDKDPEEFATKVLEILNKIDSTVVGE